MIIRTNQKLFLCQELAIKAILVICITLVAIPVFQAQQKDYYGIWKDETQTDSARALAYHTYLYSDYMWSQPDSTLIMVDSLITFAERRNNLYARGLSYDMKARSFYYKGNYFEALTNTNEALKIFEELGYKLKISQSLLLIGQIFSDQGKNLKALDYIKNSAKIAEEINNTIQRVETTNLLGDIYVSLGENDNALNYYEQALALTEKKDKLSDLYADALFNIGSIYSRKGDHVKAIDYYNRSEKIYRTSGEVVGLSNILFEKGISYEQQNKFGIALEFYKESLKLDQDFEIYYNAMIKYFVIGQLNLKMNRYEDAIDNCSKSMALAEQFESLQFQKDNSDILFEAHKALNNNDKAVEYTDKSRKYAVELKEAETRKELMQMEFAKQVEADSLRQVEKDKRKDQAYQKNLNKKNTNKNIAIGAGVLFLILAGGFYSRWRYTKKSKTVIEQEKAKSENLLLNILPAEIAEELKTKGRAEARNFDEVSVLFTDFKGFTQASEQLSAEELIEEINHCFQAFDHICSTYNIEKIKTIGDAYMAAGGLPVPNEDSVKNTVLVALKMQEFISHRIESKKANNEIFFEMRIGIHTGPVIAGIVGVKKFQYDVWGDTVNTAARMESGGEGGKVNISQSTYQAIKDDPLFVFEHRGKINAKGKGEVDMYFVRKA